MAMRYAALLRGVMPYNCKMPELRKALEHAGFTDVKTIIASGNAVFSARAASEAALQRKAEAAMKKKLGNAFLTIVRPIDALQKLLDPDFMTLIEKTFGKAITTRTWETVGRIVKAGLG